MKDELFSNCCGVPMGNYDLTIERCPDCHESCTTEKADSDVIQYAIISNLYVKPVIITEDEDDTICRGKYLTGDEVPGYILKRHLFPTQKEALLDLIDSLSLWQKAAIRQLTEGERK